MQQKLPTGSTIFLSTRCYILYCIVCLYLALGSPFWIIDTSIDLFCGDISLNPGPNYGYPCGVCPKPVKSNQKGTQCDYCSLWYHTKCCSILDHNYVNLANSSFSWICCNCDVPNFSRRLSIYDDSYFGVLNSSISLDASTSSVQSTPLHQLGSQN